MNEMHMVFCYSSPNRLRQSPFTFQSIPPNQLIKVIKVTTMLLNPVASSQHPSLMDLLPSSEAHSLLGFRHPWKSSPSVSLIVPSQLHLPAPALLPDL